MFRPYNSIKSDLRFYFILYSDLLFHVLLPPNAISLPLKNAENAKLKKLNEKKLKLLKEKLKVIFSLHIKISAQKHTKTSKNIADLFSRVK